MSSGKQMEGIAPSNTTNNALSIFEDIAVAPAQRPITLAAVEANVLISVHTDTCVECTTYARHVKEEFLGTRTAPIPIGDVEKAVTTAFPTLEKRLTISSEEVDALQEESKSWERKYHQERYECDDAIRDRKEIMARANNLRDEVVALEERLAEAKRHYYGIRKFITSHHRGIALSPDVYNTQEERQAVKRTRDEYEGTASGAGAEQTSPQDRKGKRPCITPAAVKAAGRAADPSGSRALIQYEGNENPGEGDLGDSQVDPPRGNPPPVCDPYDMDLDLDEIEELEAVLGTPQYERKKRQLEQELPGHHLWLLTATGEEEEFKRLVGQIYSLDRKARKKGVSPNYTISQEAAGWRKAILDNKKVAEAPPEPTFSYPVSGGLKHYPAPIQTLIKDWIKNPREVPPWVRQGDDGVFDSIDLDITAWERVARPKDKSLRKAFKALLVEIAKQWEASASLVQWDTVPQSASIWICTRSNREFYWTPDTNAEELLRWLTSTWRITLEDMRDHLVPYYLRSQNREVWLNKMGRIAHEQPAKGKRKPVVPLMLGGKTLTPAQLRYRALVINDLPVPSELAREAMKTSEGQPRPSSTANWAPPASAAGASSSQQDDGLLRQVHDAVRNLPGSSPAHEQSAVTAISRAPMDLDEPEPLV